MDSYGSVRTFRGFLLADRKALLLRIAPYLVFASSFIYLLYLVAPENTWINTDSDGSTYVAAAKFLRVSHPTGAPLLNLWNAVAIRLPLPGSEFWRIAIWSAVSSAGTATLLWLITRNLIAPLLFVAAGTVVSQSTIVESYAQVTFFMVLAYYLHTKDRHSLKYIACGLGAAIHHLAGLAFLPLAIADLRDGRTLKNAAWILIGVPFYLYIPLANRPPYPFTRGEAITDYLRYFFGQGYLMAGLAVIPPDNLITRILDAGALVIGGLGVGLIAVIRAGLKVKDWLLIGLVAGPFLYYFVTLPPQAFVYIVPSFAFAAILATRVPLTGTLKEITIAGALLFIGLNTVTYNIGATLDTNLSATSFIAQVETVPDNAVVFVGHRGWEIVTINLYNLENPSRNIFPASSADQDKERNLSEMTRAAVEKRLYWSVLTNPQTYEVKLVEDDPGFLEIYRAIYGCNTTSDRVDSPAPCSDSDLLQSMGDKYGRR